MTLLGTVYCTEAEIERFLSTQGVVAHTDHDENGVADDDVIDDCINDAKAEIDLYCGQRYSEASLAGSHIVSRWAKVLATLFVCECRGNSPPESLQREADRIRVILERILSGEMSIPGVAFSSDLRPVFSNVTVDRRYRFGRIRSIQASSSNAQTRIVRHHVEDVITYG
jgi:phage gp36-like protein